MSHAHIDVAEAAQFRVNRSELRLGLCGCYCDFKLGVGLIDPKSFEIARHRGKLRSCFGFPQYQKICGHPRHLERRAKACEAGPSSVVSPWKKEVRDLRVHPAHVEKPNRLQQRLYRQGHGLESIIDIVLPRWLSSNALDALLPRRNATHTHTHTHGPLPAAMLEFQSEILDTRSQIRQQAMLK
ncbi:hypothetical protein KCU88_g125, partial [Aureobasidium melanogenum]